METTSIDRQLRLLATEHRPIACLGCGFEHGCSVHGCAVINGAISEMERLRAENRDLRQNCYTADAVAMLLSTAKKRLAAAERAADIDRAREKKHE